MQVVTGTVVHGKGLGRTVGMPTANLDVEQKHLPKPGVYATRLVCKNRVLDSVTNIGTRPSVDNDHRITVETFILDFDEDIYGEHVALEIYKFLRPVMKFCNLKEVQEQVEKDVISARIYFAESLKK